MKFVSFLSFVISIILLYSCGAGVPFYKDDKATNSTLDPLSIGNIDYELYLVGGIGEDQSQSYDSDIVSLIKSELRVNSKNQSVVFLGNSFAKNGMPDEESDEFSRIDNSIEECIRKLKDNTDKVYFIPGNEEWFDGQDYTVSALQNVEDYLESKVEGKNIFVPSNGCGEPKLVELTDDLILLLIDSQWVLQGDNSQERKRSGCEIDNELELAIYIEDILARNKKKNVVIAAHHPVYSNGITGGNYGVASHMLPLPILGSIITSIKKVNGGPQKFGHPQYEAYRSTMELALSNFEGIIYTSAHDKNLQYINERNNHYVVAGSGTDVDYVQKGGDAEFAYMSKGFTKITHTKDLELWLEFYIPDPANTNVAKSIYRKMLYKKELNDYADKSVYKDLDNYPSTVKTEASKVYSKGKIGMGETYREEWGTIVDAPLLLLDNVKGGLTPVQQGGGFQTKSLRLQNPNGNQWVIRSIDKDIAKIVPPALRKTFAEGIMQDGLSAAHPYGAVAIPKLADAANIYHANPKFVWLPKQKALGDYNNDFAERLYLFEERPGGNMDIHSSYGGATNSVNTPKLIEKLLKNHKHKVDQEYVLRARLFDLFVGDWDRHDDQWRWGVYQDNDSPDRTTYRAIPRDRDQVFFKNDGILNYIASRPYIKPSLRKFDFEIDNVSGLSFNARHFDRHFIAQMNKQDFINAARIMQANITDEVIMDAFSDWPKEIYDISGDRIIEMLKVRRANLVETAVEFYKYLSREVTVIGTNGRNVFDVTTLKNNQLLVEAYHIDDDEKHLIWSRHIDGDDCNEVRLFGLKKKDVFNFSGDEKSTVKVRIVGGSGNDILNNSSKYIKILAYDRSDGMTLNGGNIRSKLSDYDGVNRFDRNDWKINKSIHFPLPTFYTDEGVGLSYNVLWQRNGFRKNPYQSSHSLSLGYFWANSAFVGKYKGHFPMVMGPKWGVKLDADLVGPSFTQFFYGLGNEYVNFEEALPNESDAGSTSFFIVRGKHVDINSHLIRDLGNNRAFSINPSVEYFDLSDTPNDDGESRFIFLDEANRSSEDFESKLYVGLGLNYSSDRLNSPTIPTKGFLFDVGADYKQSVSNTQYSNLTLSSSVAAYIPFTPTHIVVLATNMGGAYTIGDYEFFHANYLSSQSRLRGYKTNRFGGDGMVYHSTDLRIKLLQGSGSFKSGLGIYGSFDYGRSFLEDEDIHDWHTSYGGGVYLTPLNLVGFKVGYHIAKEDNQLTIGGSLVF